MIVGVAWSLALQLLGSMTDVVGVNEHRNITAVHLNRAFAEYIRMRMIHFRLFLSNEQAGRIQFISGKRLTVLEKTYQIITA